MWIRTRSVGLALLGASSAGLGPIGCSNDQAEAAKGGAAGAAGSTSGGAVHGGTSGSAGAGGGTSSGGVPTAGVGGATTGGSSGTGGGSGAGGGPWIPSFETLTLSDDFYAEGAAVGDIDGDAVLDLVAGPHWYAGPDFELGGELYDAPSVDINEYSEHFLTFVDDVDLDGALDVIAIGEQATDARWYRNPGPANLTMAWDVHTIQASGVGNEAPAYVDLTGDGKKELVFMTDGQVGFARPGEDPQAPWPFTNISTDQNFVSFTHGLGVGDVDGDGHLDVVERTGWWRQLPNGGGDPSWERHAAALGEQGGAQMYVYDVDGDGDNDVVTSLNAHGYGLAWYEQDGGGFIEHEILGDMPEGENFSQLHAVAAADLNGDGLTDVVTGKRYYAHSPPQDPGGTDPAVLYWFELQRDGGDVTFVPHLIHADSGVGCVFAVRDVNGDGKADIFTSSKKGTFLHLQN